MNILIAVEDKHFGEAQANFVINHHWPADTRFNVLHVVEPIYTGPLPEGYATSLTKDLDVVRRNRGLKLVSMVASLIKEKLPDAFVEETVVDGRAKDQILSLAEKWGAGIIVVGSHGRAGITKFLLGSVSSAILSYAKCSVLVVRLPRNLIAPIKEKAKSARRKFSLRKKKAP